MMVGIPDPDDFIRFWETGLTISEGSKLEYNSVIFFVVLLNVLPCKYFVYGLSRV